MTRTVDLPVDGPFVMENKTVGIAKGAGFRLPAGLHRQRDDLRSNSDRIVVVSACQYRLIVYAPARKPAAAS